MINKIIVFEGIDKSGKTTQSQILQAKLLEKGHDCVIMEFPNNENETGPMIRKLLAQRHNYRHEFFHILMSANRWEEAKKIEGYLMDGKIIIMNRYYHSNLIYGMCNNVDYKWLYSLDEQLPREGLTIVLEINPEESFNREVERDNFEVNKELMIKAAKLYREIGMPLGWKMVDGQREKKEVAKDVWNLVKEVL
jgi:dTMP kinase